MHLHTLSSYDKLSPFYSIPMHYLDIYCKIVQWVVVFLKHAIDFPSYTQCPCIIWFEFQWYIEIIQCIVILLKLVICKTSSTQRRCVGWIKIQRLVIIVQCIVVLVELAVNISSYFMWPPVIMIGFYFQRFIDIAQCVVTLFKPVINGSSATQRPSIGWLNGQRLVKIARCIFILR